MRNIVVFGGAGASGRHISASLEAAGNTVTIVDPAIQSLRVQGGMRVVYADSSETTVSFQGAQLYTPHDVRRITLGCDLVICVPKAFDLNADLAQTIIKHTDADAPVLTLSNGVMPSALGEAIRLRSIENIHGFADALFSNDRELITGVINYPATKTADGVKLGVTPQRVNEVGITIASSTSSALIHDICAVANIGCNVKQRAAKVVFGKLGDMLSVGPQALLDTTFVDAADIATPTGKIVERILREYHAIAKVVGVDMGTEDQFVAEMQAVMQKKGAFKGSMYPDIMAGTRTEKDAVHGALAELAKNNGLQAPAIAQTYELLTLVEDKRISVAALRGQLRDVTSTEEFCAFNVALSAPSRKL